MIQVILLTSIALIAGFGIPVMAALNAKLGIHLASPVLASCILFCVGFIISLIILLLMGMPQIKLNNLPPAYLLTGGCFVAFYVFSITAIAPHLGLGNAIFFVLLGQLVSAAFIDHFGLFGTIKNEITLERGIGLMLLTIGVFMARKTV